MTRAWRLSHSLSVELSPLLHTRAPLWAYTVQVARVESAVDGGRILNPKTARSQIIGGIVGGIGMALLEETVSNRTGRAVNTSLANYVVAARGRAGYRSLPALSQRRQAMTTNSSSSTRRNILATVVAAGALALAVAFVQAPQAATSQATPEGPGSASGAPHLPRGFTDTFTSRYVSANGVRLHAVVGGKGPPLLLIHGWPGSWYYWRLVMPALARNFEVIAEWE